MIGKTLSHYKVVAEIGRGGMGVVYRALDLRLNREVALKVLPPELVADPERKRRFVQEAQSAAALGHPNIATVFDIDEAEGVTFIAMELIRGESLQALLQGERPPFSRCLEIAAEVAEGMACAHEKGIVHRDLKPGNIMVTEDGRPKVIDFSLAKLLEPLGEGSELETALRGETDPGKVMGTVSHMSPEQARGKKVDHRSDIFSFGIVLHEMLGGKAPFLGPSRADTLSAILNTPPPRLPAPGSQVPSELAYDLQRIVDKCLEKEPSKRYQSIRDLALDLRAARRNLESGTTTMVAAQPPRRGWIYAVAAGVVVLLLLGWFLLKPAFLPSDEAPAATSTKPSLAVMYFENLSGETDLEKILVNMLITNLSRYEEIDVVGSQRLFDILKLIGEQDAESIDKRVATEVAQRAEVETMLLGSIVKVGERIRITSQLCDVETGNNIGAGQVEGTKVEDIFDMTDQLTEQVIDMMEVSSSEFGDQSPQIADVTTDSYEAYRFYQKGIEDKYRFEFSSAAENFEKAKAIDPTFAMAHLQWAVSEGGIDVLNFTANLLPFRESLNLAKKHSSEATDLERRYIDFYHALFNRDFASAITQAADLLERYPDEKDFMLAAVPGWIGNEEQSIRALKKMLERDPTYANAVNILAYMYAAIKDHENAIATVKDYLQLQPDVWNPYDSAFEIYMSAGRFDEAYDVCKEALEVNPGWDFFHWRLGHVDILRGQGDEARKKMRHYAVVNPSREVRATSYIGHSYLFEGRYQEALAELEKVLELARGGDDAEGELWGHYYLAKMLTLGGDYPNALEELSMAKQVSSRIYDSSFNPILIMTEYLAGSAMVKKGDFIEARRRAESIRQFVERDGYESFYLDLYHLLLAEMHLARGEVEAAMTAIDEISFMTSRWNPRYQIILADIRAQSGDVQKAMIIEESFYSYFYFSRSRVYGGDPFDYFLACSRVNYNLGKLYEQQGDESRAVEYFEKALEQWKNADEDLPELLDVKARLARLN